VITKNSDDMANDNVLSECSKKQNKGFMEFLSYGFGEKRKQNEYSI
jgi:hypothetical protein